MKEGSRLYFFTSAFPYGNGETFIENEIEYLQSKFDKLIIIPLYWTSKNNERRDIPGNFELLPPIITSKFRHYCFGLFSLESISIYARDFFRHRVYLKHARISKFLVDLCTTNSILRCKWFRYLLDDIRQDDILYFYWGKGTVNFLPFIKVKGKKVVRFHRGDLYAFLYENYIPIQREILENINVASFISNHGKQYLLNLYQNIKIKSFVSYLGTKDYGITPKSDDGILRIISCSNIIHEKRLYLIYEALQLISDKRVEWKHIGNGPLLKKLSSLINKSRNNVLITFIGRLSNRQVIQFYKNNKIDIFINVSSSEGLPVSIMEAISFNIPVIATNVGGTNEIVNGQTGHLLSPNPTKHEITEAIEMVCSKRMEPRVYWKQHFNCDYNYPRFINDLLIKS